MKQRDKILLPRLLSVDAINSLYHFSLEGRAGKGELHDFYEMVFVESGFYYVILDGERFEVPPGSCIFFAPNVFHSGDGVTRSTATVSIVSFDCISPAMRCFDNRVFALDKDRQKQLSAFFDAALAACEKSPRGGLRARDGVPPHRLQMLRAQLELFLLELYTEGENPAEPSNRRQYKKECFSRLSDYMKAHLAERLTLADLAAACSMSDARRQPRSCRSCPTCFRAAAALPTAISRVPPDGPCAASARNMIKRQPRRRKRMCSQAVPSPAAFRVTLHSPVKPVNRPH